MSTDTDTETDRETNRCTRLFVYSVSATDSGFTVQFPIGYVIDHDSAGPVHSATLYFMGEMLGDFRFLSDVSPAALAEELRHWLARSATDEQLDTAKWAYAPGVLHVIDDGEADDWARLVTTIIKAGPYDFAQMRKAFKALA